MKEFCWEKKIIWIFLNFYHKTWVSLHPKHPFSLHQSLKVSFWYTLRGKTSKATQYKKWSFNTTFCSVHVCSWSRRLHWLWLMSPIGLAKCSLLSLMGFGQTDGYFLLLCTVVLRQKVFKYSHDLFIIDN